MGKMNIRVTQKEIFFYKTRLKVCPYLFMKKKRVLDTYKELSRWQIDSLKEVFREEKDKFDELAKEFPEDVYNNQVKLIIEWVFVLDGIKNHDLLILELINNYNNSNDVIDYCLEELKEHIDNKNYIYFFDTIKEKFTIKYRHWNDYLFKLSSEEEYDKLSNVDIPEINESLFLKSCKTSYLLKSLAFDKIKERDIESTFEFIRKNKNKLVVSQFTYSLYYYYLYKSNNINKFLYRLTNNLLLKSMPEKVSSNEISYLQKKLFHLVVLMYFFNSSMKEKICNHIYKSIRCFINKEIDGKHKARVIEFFIENKNNISQIVSYLSLFKEGNDKFYSLINDNIYGEYIEIDDDIFLIQKLFYINNLPTKKNIIDTILSQTKSVGFDVVTNYLSIKSYCKDDMEDYFLDNITFSFKEDKTIFYIRDIISKLDNKKNKPSYGLILKIQKKISDYIDTQNKLLAE